MARRKQSGLDLIAAMPWPAGVLLGLIAFWLIRYGIGMYFSAQNSAALRPMGEALSKGAFSMLAWIALGLCWIGAAASFFKSRHRKALLDTQTGLDSLSAMDWRQFEMLVGEAFRRRGYQVEETGLGGADGGIDLILRKNGKTELVQCKQWRTRQVKVPTVREMWGLAAHHRANGVKIVCVGNYTADAAAFAEGKNIELINGSQLLELVRDVQADTRPGPTADDVSASHTANSQTLCPNCGSAMVLRKNRNTGAQFWGCSNYPRCKGTRQV